jgi:hypothetical protein
MTLALLGPLTIWGMVLRDWNPLWVWLGAPASFGGMYYLVGRLPGPDALRRTLGRLRPGAVILRGPGSRCFTFGPDGIDVWSTGPLAVERSFAWSDVASLETNAQALKRHPTRPANGMGAGGLAVVVQLRDGSSGEVLVDPDSQVSPTQTAAEIQAIARQALAVQASTLTEPTAARRPRLPVPLANRRWWPTSPFVCWFGLGASFATASFATGVADQSSDWLAVGLGAAVPVMAAFAIGGFGHFKRPVRRRGVRSFLKPVIALLLVAAGLAASILVAGFVLFLAEGPVLH